MQRSPRLDDLQLWNVYKKKREEKFRAGHPSFSSCLLFIAAPPFFSEKQSTYNLHNNNNNFGKKFFLHKRMDEQPCNFIFFKNLL